MQNPATYVKWLIGYVFFFLAKHVIIYTYSEKIALQCGVVIGYPNSNKDQRYTPLMLHNVFFLNNYAVLITSNQ